MIALTWRSWGAEGSRVSAASSRHSCQELDQFVEAGDEADSHQIGPITLRSGLRQRRRTGAAQSVGLAPLAALLLRAPGRHVGNEGLELGPQWPHAAQERNAVLDRAQQRQQRDEPFVERPHDMPARTPGGGIIGEVHAQDREFGHIGRDPPLLHLDGWRRSAREAVGDPAPRVAKDGRLLCEQRRQHAAWEDYAVHQRGRHGAEHDFFHARDRNIKHSAGVEHGWKADQGSGEAGELEHIGSWRAVEQRHVKAQADPERDRGRHQFGRVGEVGHDHHHGDTAEHGAEGTINRLCAQCARQRLAGKVDGDHRPPRIPEVQPERDVQRQQNCDVAVERENDRAETNVLEHRRRL